MPPDIFDFITTRDEVREPLRDTGNLPDLKPVPQISLIPIIPANYRLDKTVGTNPDALLDNLAQRINALPDSRPAYEYTAQQEQLDLLPCPNSMSLTDEGSWF